MNLQRDHSATAPPEDQAVPHALDEYLREWEERRERGEDVSPTDLCRDRPEARAELARLIGMLEECDRILATPEMPPATQEEGADPTVVAGYVVRGKLGRGGMGEVYRVWDPVLRREAALKWLRVSGLAALPDEAAHLARRFQQEAQVLARLKHVYIVPVFEAGMDDGRPYFVMECVPDGSLVPLLPEMTAAGPQVIVPFVEKVARAVHYAHGQGVLHRDLKPANILVEWRAGENKPWVPRVADFGLAKLLSAEVDPEPEAGVRTQATLEADAPDTDMSRLTAPGFQPGTPGYMAPEQFDPALGAVSPATDVWALGVILYELLTGQRPFAADCHEELRQRICCRTPQRPRSVRRTIGRQLEAVVMRCLEKEPARRFASAAALADQLARHRHATRRRVAVLSAALAVAVSALLVLALALPPVRGPGLQEARTAEKDMPGELLRELAEKRVITLLPTTGYPAWFQWRVNPVTPLRAPNRAFTFNSLEPSLVELLPAVPGRSFRFSAEVQHRRATGNSSAGIYFGYGRRATPNGTEHSYYSLGFNDKTDVAKKYPAAKLPGNPAMLEVNLAYEKERTHLQHWAAGLNLTFRPAVDAAPMPWRKLTVEVRAEAGWFRRTGNVWIRWGEGKPVGPLPIPRLRERVRALWANNRPALAGIGQPALDLSGGLGVYLGDAEAAFRNVQVELLDHSGRTQ